MPLISYKTHLVWIILKFGAQIDVSVKLPMNKFSFCYCIRRLTLVFHTVVPLLVATGFELEEIEEMW